MKKIFICLLLITGLQGFSQGENDNWYFGPYIGLNFDTNPPALLSGGAMKTFEGVATISRPNGDLLFYTDGVTIWNREHGAMLNGTGLTGDNDSQSVVISPHPGNNNIYYVFTMPRVQNTLATGTACAYTTVDMSLGTIGTDGLPLGDVVAASKNTSLLDESGNTFTLKSEIVASVSHADNQGYWILYANNSNLYSYRIDSQGFHNIPVVSGLPAPIDPVVTQMHMRVSPNLSPGLELPYSNLICISRWPGGFPWATPNFGIRVFSFDNNTGLITPDYLMTSTLPTAYATEFSANGEVLYTINFGHQAVRAFDVFNGVNKILYHGATGFYGGSIQRAVNGEIYVAFDADNTRLNWQHLGMITNPESYASCGVNLNGLFVGTDFMGGNSTHETKCLPPLVPILQSPGTGCYESLVLGFPENNNITHQVGSTITTNNFYAVGTGLNVTLKAGDIIQMLPGTHIQSGSLFLAEIEDCPTLLPMPKAKPNYTPVRYTINEDDTNMAMVLYPNPSSDNVTITIPGAEIKNIAVYSSDGKTVFTADVNDSSYILNITNYTEGIYIVTAVAGNGQSYMNKVIKE